jgi:hypothetical protein
MDCDPRGQRAHHRRDPGTVLVTIEAERGLASRSRPFQLCASASGAMPSGQPVTLKFRITDSMGMAVTSYQDDQTKLMHFYVVRSDLSGFQHVHPEMATDGTWTANLSAIAPAATGRTPHSSPRTPAAPRSHWS